MYSLRESRCRVYLSTLTGKLRDDREAHRIVLLPEEKLQEVKCGLYVYEKSTLMPSSLRM